VFVRRGELRLVAPPPRTAAPPAQWALLDGLRAVEDDTGASLAPTQVIAAR
jgi:hypothetical protein